MLSDVDGSSTVADVVFLDNLSGQRVILEVSVVTIGSDSSLAAGARAGLGGVRAQLQAREREKRNHGVIQKVLSDPGNNTILPTPEGHANIIMIQSTRKKSVPGV